MSNSSQPTKLETVLKLLDSGFSIIPSGKGEKGKAPLVEWKKYQDEKPTEKFLCDYQKAFHPKLWGIVTNSSVAVVDADTPEARTELTSKLGQPHVITPRGGAHWYIDTTDHPMKTVAGLLPGIDIRGVGGFVNIVGANTEGEYHIKKTPSPDTLIPYGKLPEFILNALDDSKSTSEPTPKPQGEPIREGQRNSTLLSLAGSMRYKGMPSEAIQAALIEINRLQCQPPLEKKEVLTITKSVAKYEPTGSALKSQGFKPDIISAPALSEMDFPELKFALPGMIPEGFTILAGRPKSGKSWWALQAAFSVASGKNILDGSECEKGRALVLGLEDGMRRLQERVKKIYASDFVLISTTKLEGGGSIINAKMGSLEIPDELDLAVKWPRIGDGCIEELEKYLDKHPDTRLIVIDIIKRITRRKGRGTTYDEDYESIQPLQELAIRRGVAILGVHHTRKALSDDPIEMVSGTFGLTGGADSIIVVQRVADGESKFSFSGRDIEMRELAMRFNKIISTWTCLGDADSHFISDERERIIECLGDDSLSPIEIARLLGKNPSTTRTMLYKMLRDGQLDKDSKGKYSVDKPIIDPRIYKKKGG